MHKNVRYWFFQGQLPGCLIMLHFMWLNLSKHLQCQLGFLMSHSINRRLKNRRRNIIYEWNYFNNFDHESFSSLVPLRRPSRSPCQCSHWAASPWTAGTPSAILWCSRAQPRGLARASSSYGLCRVSSWSPKPSWWNAAACCPSWPTRRGCSLCATSTGEVGFRMTRQRRRETLGHVGHSLNVLHVGRPLSEKYPIEWSSGFSLCSHRTLFDLRVKWSHTVLDAQVLTVGVQIESVNTHVQRPLLQPTQPTKRLRQSQCASELGAVTTCYSGLARLS